jgi:ATP-dependent exoDNAse (exonuclease V) beta subunit
MKASAGSGKTYSLARQYISLLLKSDDRYAYRHVLAVTFTNKATDEMKSRILKELYIMASDPSASDYKDYFVPSLFSSEDKMQAKAKRVLQDILHDYSAFAVSTIDRFFQHTLKAFSREIGHFASYQVELDKDSLVAESVDRVLDSLTEQDSGLLSWLTENVLEQIEQGGRYSMDANLLEMALRLKSPQRQEALEAAGVKAEDLCSKERLMEIRNRCREIARFCRFFRKWVRTCRSARTR